MQARHRDTGEIIDLAEEGIIAHDGRRFCWYQVDLLPEPIDEQGETAEGLVVCNELTHGYKDIVMSIPKSLNVGDKVIVQIRKAERLTNTEVGYLCWNEMTDKQKSDFLYELSHQPATTPEAEPAKGDLPVHKS